MKRIEIIVEQASADRLSVALPHAGVSSVTIGVGLMGECKGAWISPAQERPVSA